MTVSTIASFVSGASAPAPNQNPQVAEAIRSIVNVARPEFPPPQDTTSFPTAAVLQNQVANLRIASQAIAQSGAALDVAGVSGSEISRVLGQLRALAARASSESLSLNERIQISSQVQALRLAINRIAATGGSGTQALDGDAAQAVTAIGNLTAENLFANDPLDVSTAENAARTEAVIATAQQTVTGQLQAVVDFQGGIEFTAAAIDTAIQNNDASRSLLSEADLDVFASAAENTPPAASREFTAADVAAQTNRLPGDVLQLLGE